MRRRTWQKIGVMISTLLLLDGWIVLRDINLLNNGALLLFLLVINPLCIIWIGRLGLDLVERRILREAQNRPTSFFLFAPAAAILAPGVLIIELGAAAAVAFALYEGTSIGDISPPLWLVGFVILSVSLILHGFPQHDRRIKYGLLLLGSFCLTGSGGILSSGSSNEDDVGVAVVLLLVLEPIAVFLLSLRAHRSMRPNEPIGPNDEASRRAIKSYHRAMRLGLGPQPGYRAFLVFTLVRQIPFALPWLLVTRYYSTHKLAHRPVLYLRSFSNPEGARLFVRKIVPSVMRYAPIIGLAHETQSSADLHRGGHLAQHAHLRAVGDDRWQQWVDIQLGRCLGVIIDTTQQTEGVVWELQRALQLVPRSRIFIIHAPGFTSEVSPGVPFESATLDLVTAHLQQWVKAMLREELGCEPFSNPW